MLDPPATHQELTLVRSLIHEPDLPAAWSVFRWAEPPAASLMASHALLDATVTDLVGLAHHSSTAFREAMGRIPLDVRLKILIETEPASMSQAARAVLRRVTTVRNALTHRPAEGLEQPIAIACRELVAYVTELAQAEPNSFEEHLMETISSVEHLRLTRFDDDRAALRTMSGFVAAITFTAAVYVDLDLRFFDNASDRLGWVADLPFNRALSPDDPASQIWETAARPARES